MSAGERRESRAAPGGHGERAPGAAGPASKTTNAGPSPPFSPFDLRDVAERGARLDVPSGRRGRPASHRWQPIAVAVQLDAWSRRPWTDGALPTLDVYAPNAAVHAWLTAALRPAWDVRPVATLADLCHPADWERPVVYAPDGADLPGLATPVAGGAGRESAESPGRGQDMRAVGTLGDRVARTLRARLAVVYGAAPDAAIAVPVAAAGLPVRPVFDASRILQAPAAAHLQAIRLTAARMAADHVAHEAWARLVDGRAPTDAAGAARAGTRAEHATDGDVALRRRTADALRRLFLRPDGYPDVQTLAAAVGLRFSTLARAAGAHFGLTRLRAVHDVLLAFHATRLLADAQVRQGKAATALGQPLLPRLNVLVRAVTGMTPGCVRRWGIAVEAPHLLETVLATSGIPTRRTLRGTSGTAPLRRPRADPHDDSHGVSRGTAPLAPAPSPPGAATERVRPSARSAPPRWLPPDPGLLPEYQAEFPRFPSAVLPEGHPYAWSHPASPHHTGVRPPVDVAPSLADRARRGTPMSGHTSEGRTPPPDAAPASS